MTLSAVWWNDSRMTFSCCHLLNGLLDAYHAVHLTRHDPPPADGCVLIFHGSNEQLYGQGPAAAGRINRYVASMRWVIFISIGDEATEFPLHLLDHPNSKLWVQTPLPTTKADRYLIEGYPAHTTRERVPRDLDWFFAGQVTHTRRQACVGALSRRNHGLLIGTAGFGQGMPQSDYLHHMSRARIVPCPSGPASPDTFRVWEALECGAVPIVDARSLRDSTLGFWSTVLGGDHPLPLIEDWADLSRVMDRILLDYDLYSAVYAAWWRTYKLRWHDSLGYDLISLGAR